MIDTTPTTLDRIAPNSTEAEEAVLGAVLINPDSLDDVSFLLPSDFFIVRNGWIWEAVTALSKRGDAIDNVTVVQELADASRLDTIGGSAYVTRLINNTPTHIHAETYARLVQRMAVRRAILTAAGDMATLALDGSLDTSEVVNKAQASLEEIATRRTADFVSTGVEVVNDATDEFLEWISDPAEIRGLRSGIPALDKALGGFIPGSRPYTFYGASGMGKTRLISYIALNLMEQAEGFVVSTETHPKRWIHRVVADLTNIPLIKLISGQLTKPEQALALTIYERFNRVAGQYSILRVSNPTPADIRAAVRREVRASRCKWVVIDSINNVSGDKDIFTRVSMAAAVSMSIGLDQGCAVLQTAQTGRNAKDRGTNLLPRLYDGKGSGDVEDTSAAVFGIYRHDYYVQRRILTRGNTFPEGNTTLIPLKNDQTDLGGWIPLRQEDGIYVFDDRVNDSASSASKNEPMQTIDLEGF